jgi:hypothetical protein
MRWAENVVHTTKLRNADKILIIKPEGKGPFGRPRHKWEDNIRIALWKTECEGVGWMNLALVRDRSWALVNEVMHLQVP